jgi:UDP-N-acetylmuramate--alanine ligase
LLELVRPGDQIVVMGARDDTLSEFASNLLGALGAEPPARKSPSRT